MRKRAAPGQALAHVSESQPQDPVDHVVISSSLVYRRSGVSLAVGVGYGRPLYLPLIGSIGQVQDSTTGHLAPVNASQLADNPPLRYGSR